MKWEEIIAVSGRPGLYRIVGQSKSGILAEHITDKKKVLAPPFRVTALKDISVFTETDEVPLREVMTRMARTAAARPIPDKKASKEELTEFFREVLPDYDEERFYPSHMRKIIGWYRLLEPAGLFEAAGGSEEADSDQK